jgi:hypothetical protein
MSLNVVEKAFNKKIVNMVKLADGTNLDGTNKALYGTPYTTGDAVYDTADNTANQQINVRSDTVYYYVSKTTTGLVVNTYTGYANAPKTAGEDVKGIYAVATKTTSNYWVANVVVVEMDNFKGAAENVFVYNYPENVNTLRNATIDIIKADGTKASVTITNPEDVDYGPAYLYGNETDGYSLVMMKDEDIKANNYAIGYVTAAVDLVTTDYAEITDVLYDSTASAGNEYKLSTDPKDAHRLKDNDSASYYEYTISQVTGRTSATKYDKGTLEDSTAKAVLTETVTVKKAPKTNLVFASYDNRGNIIYAISFNQDDSDASKTATDVFQGLLKEAESDEHTVTVKTEGINDVDDQTIKVADGEDKTITVAQTGYSLDSYTAVITDTDTSVKDSVLELKDGTLVATNVTNNITITLTYVANSHTLIVNNTQSGGTGTAPNTVKLDTATDVTIGNENTVTYGNHTITFVGVNATKYTYTITSGGTTSDPAPVTMTDSGTKGTITVPATDADVTVNIIYTAKTEVGYTITKTCSEDKTAEPTVTVSNESTSNNVYKGDDVKFSITGVNAKDQVVSVSYSVGGGDPVALDLQTSGNYTIPGSAVTDTLVITVVTRAKTHAVTLSDSSSTNLTVNDSTSYTSPISVDDATGTITIKAENPIKITGDLTKYAFERSDDAKTWTIKNVTDAVELEIANAD